MKQTTDAKKGEILFRKRLYEQQILQNQVYFQDEFNAQEIETILCERMRKTFNQINRLKEKGINISPYVEIGAERGQRSLVIENQPGCEGAAADISYYSLKSAEHFKALFNCEKMPMRICCDAYHLPFLSNSIPFVFCYETLHHFPDPAPIIEEVYRILAPGGCLFFDEEPFRQELHIPLYKLQKIYSREYRRRTKLTAFFDYFFGIRSCNETEHGITENDQISIEKWQDSLHNFNRKRIRVTSPRITTSVSNNENSIKLFLHSLLGGNLCGCCFKDNGEQSTVACETISIKDVIACPNCLNDSRKVETRLDWNDAAMLCPRCENVYRNLNGVNVLLPSSSLRVLYPEFTRERAI